MNFECHGVKTLRQLAELISTAFRNGDGMYPGGLLFFDPLCTQQKIIQWLFEVSDKMPCHRQGRRAAQ